MADLTGRQFGGYVLTHEVGKGGMAVVYRAHALENEREVVAVKIISPDIQVSHDFVERFRREANTMATFKHPHILPVYTFGEEDGVSYLVMDLLTGGSLKDHALPAPLTVSNVVELTAQIASALDYAHERHVIHRDLKPANILMGNEGQALLADFGIAKFKEESVGLTASGMIIGTPSYMAPEQWRTEPISPATDIYAFGVMVFELLAGRVPFESDTPFSLMYMHLDEPPPAITQYRRGVPRTFDSIIRRALAKTPEKRYPTAGDFARSMQEAWDEHLASPQGMDNTNPMLDRQGLIDHPTPRTQMEGKTITDFSTEATDNLEGETFTGFRTEMTEPTHLEGETITDFIIEPSHLDGETFVTEHQIIVGDAPDLRWEDVTLAPSQEGLADLYDQALEDEELEDFQQHNAVDSGARLLLQRARESAREFTGDEKVLAEAVIDYVQDLREAAKRHPELEQGPYRALESYDVGDNKLFFGREEAIDAMLARSPNARFTVLHAESGAGKTSLLRAGVMPRLLAGGFLPLYVAVRRRAPQDAIKAILLPDEAKAPDLAADNLRDYLRRLVNINGENRAVFIFIDQFETFFSDVFTDDQRAHFVSEVAECLDDPLLPVHFTLAMRTEYFGLMASFQPSIPHPFENEFLLRSLTQKEAKRALILPARSQGYNYEDEVADAILNDLADNHQEVAPPQLQLVGGAMIDTLTAGRHLITMENYVSAGRAEGVLRGYLERLLSRFPVEDRNLARLIIEGLVRADQTRDVRTKTSLRDELNSLNISTANLERVLDALRENRVLRLVELDDELAYELVHDYLARQVQLDPETAARKAAQELLDRRLGDYEQFGSLLTKQELGVIEAQQAQLHLSPTARELVMQTRRTFRRQRNIAIALTVVSILGIIGVMGISLFAVQQESQNRQEQLEAAQTSEFRINQQAEISESGRLAVQGLLELDSNQIDSALQLAAQAMTLRDTAEARGSLLTILQSAPQLDHYFYGQQGEIRAVAYAPDGALIASAGVDGEIVLWEDNQPLDIQLVGHEGTIRSIAFANPTTLITAGDDGTLRRWDVTTGKGEILAQLDAEMMDIAVSGELILVGSADSAVRIWSVSGGNSLYEITDFPDEVWAVAWHPDGIHFAAGDRSGGISYFEIANNEVTRQANFPAHDNLIWSLAFHPDGDRLASGSADNTVRLWSYPDGTSLSEPLTEHSGAVFAVKFSPDGSILASASGKQTVQEGDLSIILRDNQTGRPLPNFEPLVGHADQITDIAFDPTGQFLVSGSEDQKVIRWNVAAKFYQTVANQTDVIDGMSFNGEVVLSGGTDQLATLRDAQTGEILHPPYPADERVTSTAISPDGNILAYGSTLGTVFIWQWDGTEPLFTIDAHPSAVPATRAVVFSPDGTQLASAGDDFMVKLWDVNTGELIREFTGHANIVYTVAFSPDGLTLASGDHDGVIRLWDVATGNVLETITDFHTNNVRHVAFSHDGLWLASGSRDNTIMLWNRANGETHRLEGHNSWITSLAFSGDDSMLISGSRDETLILWDVATHRALGLPLRGHADEVWSVQVSGFTAVSAGFDGNLLRWNINPSLWLSRACTITVCEGVPTVGFAE